MRGVRFTSSILLTALALVLAGCGSDSGPGWDQKEVQNAVDRFYSALNAMFTGELAPMIDVWSHADDVTYMGPTGGYEVGWSAVLADWQAQAALKLGGRVDPMNMHITAGHDLAIVTDVEQGTNTDSNGQPQIVNIRATNYFRKEGGVWKMISHHTDLLPYLSNKVKP